jgi:hypothetical protein
MAIDETRRDELTIRINDTSRPFVNDAHRRHPLPRDADITAIARTRAAINNYATSDEDIESHGLPLVSIKPESSERSFRH